MTSGRRTNEEFAVAIKRIVGNRSLRGISRLTGISHTYVDDLKWGIVPSYQVLQQFADGMKLTDEQREELFDLAGYEPVTQTTTLPPAFAQALQEVAAEYGVEPPSTILLGEQTVEQFTETVRLLLETAKNQPPP